MLEFKDYNVSSVDGVKILSDINLSFAPGIHVLMGSNGSGKSTLAQSVMGHYSYVTDGKVFIDNTEISAMPVYMRARSGLFVSSQNPIELPGISNFLFIVRSFESQGIEFKMGPLLSKFKSLCKLHNLPEDWHKRDMNVSGSGGEKKKNELVQLAMFNPDVIILDEPDSGLDVDSMNVLCNLIEDLAENGKVVILISHYRSLIEQLFSIESTTVLAKGKVFEQGGQELALKKLSEGFSGI